MAYRFRTVPANSKVTYKLRMTQTHLADVCGLAPVHINRTLTALFEIETIFKGSKVRIMDWAALATAGDFDWRIRSDRRAL